jgi:exodeoxyribonuclease-3
MLKIISWNVNGIRAATRNGMWSWFNKARPDIFLVQEIKALPEQLDPEILNPGGYQSFWNPAERKGYSGVAAFTKKEPLSVSDWGIKKFDCEGRVQVLEYKTFTLINTYFPNSQEAGKRLDFKLEFCNAMLKYCEKLRKKGRNVVLCGDYNIAHKPIDLKNPKQNEKNPGYLPEERAWMDKFTSSGFVDTFRMFNREPGHYTWWSYRASARVKDIGWRIDYHCVNEEFVDRIKESLILKKVLGSDHCPVVLKIRL